MILHRLSSAFLRYLARPKSTYMNISETSTHSITISTSERFTEPLEVHPAIVSEHRDYFTSAFLRHFKTSNSLHYEFTHQIDLKYNVLYESAVALFKDDNLGAFSQVAAQHLSSVSDHPNIKKGDLVVALFNDIEIDEVMCDAVGIFKYDVRQRILDIDESGSISLKSGIGTQKPDKGCLIINKGTTPTLLIIDYDHRDSEFWQQDFINAKLKSDESNFTREVIKATKEFVEKKLPEDFVVSKVDQVDLLRRSMDYFKESESFNQHEFEQAVLVDQEVIDSFRSHKNEASTDSGVSIPETFSMATAVVQKQASNFKGIIKLDKNFHIYVHGDRSLIESGVDSEGRKYYKLYYDKES